MLAVQPPAPLLCLLTAWDENGAGGPHHFAPGVSGNHSCGRCGAGETEGLPLLMCRSPRAAANTMTAILDVAATGAEGSLSRRLWSEARRSLLLALTLLVLLGGLFAAFLSTMPALQPAELAALQHFPPKSLQQLVAQRDVLLNYAAVNPVSVLAGLCLCYVLMQTFAIPGTLTLSVMSGALYGVKRGWLLVAGVSTLGSLSCYCLSWALGRQLAHAIWPGQLERFGAEVAARRRDMLNYVIFLRVTPILPNTFINMASGALRVPLLPFTLGTLLGCLPNNFVAVNAGSRLGELQSLKDLYDAKMLAIGAVVGVVALLPIYLKHTHQRRAQAAAGAKVA